MLIKDRDRLIRKCEEFYIKLYRTRRPQDQPFTDVHCKETGQPPPILPFEVRDAVTHLKRDKAPGEDNITAGILQDWGGNPVSRCSRSCSTDALRMAKFPAAGRMHR